MILAIMLCLSLLTTGFASEQKTADVFAMEKAGEQTHQVSVVDGSRIAIMGKNSEEISKIPQAHRGRQGSNTDQFLSA